MKSYENTHFFAIHSKGFAGDFSHLLSFSLFFFVFLFPFFFVVPLFSMFYLSCFFLFFLYFYAYELFGFLLSLTFGILNLALSSFLSIGFRIRFSLFSLKKFLFLHKKRNFNSILLFYSTFLFSSNTSEKISANAL